MMPTEETPVSKEGLMLELVFGVSDLAKLAAKPWESLSAISEGASKTGIKIPDVAYLETIEQGLRKVELESIRLRNVATRLYEMYYQI